MSFYSISKSKIFCSSYSMINFLNTLSIDGSFLIEENIFNDFRGSFNRLFDDRKFKNLKFDYVKNINVSKNLKKGTFRGLHMQKGSFAESKIIYCNKGSIIDLFVDCRKESSTFGYVNKVMLDEKNINTLLVPRGCLHSFLTLEDDTEVIYLTDNYYSPESEISVSPFSEKIINELNPYKIEVCSEKDRNSISFSEFIEKIKAPN